MTKHRTIRDELLALGLLAVALVALLAFVAAPANGRPMPRGSDEANATLTLTQANESQEHNAAPVQDTVLDGLVALGLLTIASIALLAFVAGSVRGRWAHRADSQHSLNFAQTNKSEEEVSAVGATGGIEDVAEGSPPRGAADDETPVSGVVVMLSKVNGRGAVEDATAGDTEYWYTPCVQTAAVKPAGGDAKCRLLVTGASPTAHGVGPGR